MNFNAPLLYQRAFRKRDDTIQHNKMQQMTIDRLFKQDNEKATFAETESKQRSRKDRISKQTGIEIHCTHGEFTELRGVAAPLICPTLYPVHRSIRPASTNHRHVHVYIGNSSTKEEGKGAKSEVSCSDHKVG